MPRLPRYSPRFKFHPPISVSSSFQTYNPSQTIKLGISYYTLKQIHAYILDSATLEVAAQKLDLPPEVLARTLIKLRYQSDFLNFQRLKNLTVEDIQHELGNKYNQPIKELILPLSKYNFNEIHKVILISKSLHNAAINLGLTNRGSLKVLLAKAGLDFATLKESTPKSLRAKYGDAYYKPLQAREKRTITLEKIHYEILNKMPKALIAAEFGVETIVITNYLKQFSYLDLPLTYERLKGLSKETAHSIWKENYLKPIKIIEESELAALEKELNELTDVDQQITSTPTEAVALDELNNEEPRLEIEKYPLAHAYFFSPKYTAPMDSALTSTSCTTISSPS